MHVRRQQIRYTILNRVIKRTFTAGQKAGQYFLFIFFIDLKLQLTLAYWAADYVHEFPVHAVQKVMILIIILVKLRAGEWGMGRASAEVGWGETDFWGGSNEWGGLIYFALESFIKHPMYFPHRVNECLSTI